jgi:hypothetical protein
MSRQKRRALAKAGGLEMCWDAGLQNQREEVVAAYDVLTWVAKN